ncbi:MAG: hypothetical protein Q9227_006478 [Pyrenula ochraceoflavens]
MEGPAVESTAPPGGFTIFEPVPTETSFVSSVRFTRSSVQSSFTSSSISKSASPTSHNTATTAPAASTSQATALQSSGSSGTEKAVIAIGIISGIAALGFLVFLLTRCMRQRRKEGRRANAQFVDTEKTARRSFASSQLPKEPAAVHVASKGSVYAQSSLQNNRRVNESVEMFNEHTYGNYAENGIGSSIRSSTDFRIPMPYASDGNNSPRIRRSMYEQYQATKNQVAYEPPLFSPTSPVSPVSSTDGHKLSAFDTTRPVSPLTEKEQYLHWQQPRVQPSTSKLRHLSDAMSSEVADIKSTLLSYASALNESSTSSVLPLYAPDGVFMPEHFEARIGHHALGQIYNEIFKNITLNVSMEIKEVQVVSEKWAFARTTTHGTQKVNSPGTITAEGNQELFIMQKVEGKWLIARYCFCTTNPPPGQ